MLPQTLPFSPLSDALWTDVELEVAKLCKLERAASTTYDDLVHKWEARLLANHILKQKGPSQYTRKRTMKAYNEMLEAEKKKQDDQPVPSTSRGRTPERSGKASSSQEVS